MNTTFVWIENLMMMMAGIAVIPVLVGASRDGTGCVAGERCFVPVDGAAPGTGRHRRKAPGGRIWLKLCQWRCPPAIALYQLVV